MRIVNFGSLNLDHVYTVSHFVEAGETLAAGNRVDCPGGKGLNQTIAAARAGAEIAHAGLIGAGGDSLAELLKENGVDISRMRQCDAPQGHAVIQRDPAGRNCILVYGGSNQCVSKGYIDAVLADYGQGDMILLQNEISNLSYIVESAWKKDMQIVLNASPIDDELLKLDFSKLSWLVVNETECSMIAGCQDTETAYEELKHRYPHVGILLTIGEGGSVSYLEGEEIRQKAYPVETVDTTAAGDTFLGYFAACLAMGYSRRDAMRHSSMASALAVSAFGAAPSIPTMNRVKQGLEQAE